MEIERDEWADIREDELADLLGGTHCKRRRRDGNKCCSRQIYEIIRDTMDEVNTSPVFNTSRETEGVLANVGLLQLFFFISLFIRSYIIK